MNHHKILVVEDDYLISELIGITLVSPHYEMTCVDNGKDALAALGKKPPDLVLLDIMIPPPDGWEIYKSMRSNQEFNDTRVIILTALSFSPEFLVAKNLLPTDLFMRKPFEIEELTANVANLLAVRA
jgi:DNA-binding response OmpR family regulator